MTNIVTITGGTGGFHLLKGLSNYSYNLTAIFSGFDGGGSTGIIRKEFGGIAWGDLRRGFIALSSSENIRSLASFRFDKNSSLSGHSLGNLMLFGISKLANSKEDAIKRANEFFQIPQGRNVIPSSLDESDVVFELSNGDIVKGEGNIGNWESGLKIKKVHLEPSANAYELALDSVGKADIIVIGPGGMHNSLIPNLLVKGISDSIIKSGVKIIFICNTMTKLNETESMKGSDFVKELSKYLGIVPHFSIFHRGSDYTKHEKDGHHEPVVVDMKELEKLGTRPIVANIAGEYFDRHDPVKLASVVDKLIKEIRKV